MIKDKFVKNPLQILTPDTRVWVSTGDPIVTNEGTPNELKREKITKEQMDEFKGKGLYVKIWKDPAFAGLENKRDLVAESENKAAAIVAEAEKKAKAIVDKANKDAAKAK